MKPYYYLALTAALAACSKDNPDPDGLYYLVVEQNGHVTRSQIRVQH